MDSSDHSLNPDLHFDSARRVAEAAVESAIARLQRTGSARRWDGTFFTTWPTPLTGTLAKVDRKKAEQINQELRSSARHSKPKRRLAWRVTRTKCCESIFLRLPEEILPPDLEEIYELRHLDQEEDEDDSTTFVRKGKAGALPPKS